jgi:pSer/pThr/pTyr-binding forkhead associated (FHA) protein
MQDQPRIADFSEPAPEGASLALTVAVGPRHGQTVTADGSGRLLVGRAQGCQLQIIDRRMSREHFVAEWSEGNWKLRDLSSRNGTFLNDQRVERISEVRDGDRLTAGDTVFEVRIGEANVGRVDSKHVPAAKGTSRKGDQENIALVRDGLV